MHNNFISTVHKCRSKFENVCACNPMGPTNSLWWLRTYVGSSDCRLHFSEKHMTFGTAMEVNSIFCETKLFRLRRYCSFAGWMTPFGSFRGFASCVYDVDGCLRSWLLPWRVRSHLIAYKYTLYVNHMTALCSDNIDLHHSVMFETKTKIYGLDLTRNKKKLSHCDYSCNPCDKQRWKNL